MIFKTQRDRVTVQIKSKDICQGEPNVVITEHLRKLYGNVCGKHGFAIKPSIHLLDRTLGKLVSVDSVSCIEYDVTYKMDAIYPATEDEYECVIENQTKMGLIAYLDYSPDDEPVSLKTSPILFIIPKQLGGDMEAKLGQKLKVSVLDSRIKYQSRQIQSVAKIV